MALLQYKGISSVIKTSGWELGGFERRQLVVCGTKGTVELKPLEWPGESGQKTHKREVTDTGWTAPSTCAWSEDMDRYDGMMASFAAMVRGEKENPYTSDYELELYKTVLRCCGVNVE
jgi:predicted dehydrogenase